MTSSNYDPNNVFAKILRAELPCKKVYEDEFALAIHNINPEAPIHVLVLVKGEYQNLAELAANGTAGQVEGFLRAVGKAAEAAGALRDGCRFISNNGPNSHQEVAHLHMHILGGQPLGPLVMGHSAP